MTRTAVRDFQSTTKATAWKKDRSAGFLYILSLNTIQGCEPE
ncbi:hypothetical protein [Neisseria mucosa]